jgi:hypothetical protein
MYLFPWLILICTFSHNKFNHKHKSFQSSVNSPRFTESESGPEAPQTCSVRSEDGYENPNCAGRMAMSSNIFSSFFTKNTLPTPVNGRHDWQLETTFPRIRSGHVTTPWSIGYKQNKHKICIMSFSHTQGIEYPIFLKEGSCLPHFQECNCEKIQLQLK